MNDSASPLAPGEGEPTPTFTGATPEEAARLLDLIDELGAVLRNSKRMGLGEVATANGIRAQFMDRWLSKLSRNKGAAFERDVCAIFSSALGREDRPFKRNIGQARDGGNDIDVGPLVVEVKIRKTLGTVYGWLQQAIAAIKVRWSTDNLSPVSRRIPIVVARQDGDVSPIVILRLSDFLILTRDELMAALEAEDAA